MKMLCQQHYLQPFSMEQLSSHANQCLLANLQTSKASELTSPDDQTVDHGIDLLTACLWLLMLSLPL